MNSSKKGLGIIFHSGSYDRFYHGLSIALAGSALGREVKVFFTYEALEYLKKKNSRLNFKGGDKSHQAVIEKGIKKGHLQPVPELIRQLKAMNVKIYACTNSMGLLNITRDELIEEVDKSMGLTTFLTETVDHQLLFI